MRADDLNSLISDTHKLKTMSSTHLSLVITQILDLEIA